MKPIRSNELEFFNKIIENKFYDKRQALETEITSEAQKLADKKSPTMAKPHITKLVIVYLAG